MATLIGVIKSVVGEAFAVGPDGGKRLVSEGDRLFAGEQLVTGPGAAVVVTLINGEELSVAASSSLSLDPALLAETAAEDAGIESPEQASAPTDQDLTDVDELLSAIEAGQDPTLAGEATAAGAGAGGAGGAGGGGSSSFVLLDETGARIDPDVGYPTGPISSGPEFLAIEPADNAPELPDSTPSVEIIYLDGPEVVAGPGAVNEAGLADGGSDAESDAENTYGSLVINSPDGVSAIEVQGADGVWVNVLGGGTVIGTYGSVTFDASGNWVYTLGDNTFDHAGDASVGESFTVRVVDGDGDVSPTASLDVVVLDDAPSIEVVDGDYSALVVDESDFSVVDTGNFSSAFQASLGADGGSVSYSFDIKTLDSGLVDTATGESVELHLNGDVLEGWVGGDSSMVAFTAQIDADGELQLEQLRALRHPDTDSDNEPLAVAGGALQLVATATDGDGDTASASLDLGGLLVFRDDGPSIELADAELSSLLVDETNLAVDATADFSGAFSSAFGADGAGSVSYALSATGDPSGLVDVATGLDIVLGMNGGVVEGWVNGDSSVVAFTVSVDGSGNVTLDQMRALQHPDGSNPDDPVSVNGSAIALTATITDADGDSQGASLNLGNFLTFHDDGPSIELADAELSSLVVDETNLAVDATADFSGAFSSAFGADGAGSVSYALSATGDPSGLVDVATGLDIVLGMNGGVVEGWVNGDSSVVAFTVSVDGSGNVTLDQMRALQHPDGSNPDDPVSVAGSAITLGATITDADGDQTSASLDLGGYLTFHDDGPSISVKSVYDVDLAVDETVLATNDSVDVSGAFSVSFGADGSGGSTTYAVTTVDGTDSGLVDVASGDSILLYNTASGVEGRVGGEGGAVAFSVTAVGSMVTLDQVRAIEHPTDDPNEPISPDEGTLTLTATITDKDGDSDDASLDLSGSIVFRDDGPSISVKSVYDVDLAVDETVLATDDSVDVSGAFSGSFGADGSGSTTYAVTTVDGTDSGLVDVASGDSILLYNTASGVEGRVGGEGGAVAFSVTAVGSMVTLDQVRAIEHPTDDPNEPISPDEGTLTLTATITDKDGDSDDASLDLSGSIVFRDDGPSISVKSVYDVDLAVDETVLATNDSVDVSGAFSGSFGADGSGSTTYAVTTVDGTDSGLVDVASGDSILLYNTASGVEGRVGGEGGAVAFSVTAVGSMVTLDQVRAIEHPTDDPNEPISPDEGTLTLTATITDKDGDSDDASLDLSGSIVFRDDGPSISVKSVYDVDLAVDETVLATDDSVDVSGAFSGSFGADGSGSTTYAVTTVDGTDSGLVDVASGDSILLYNTASGVEGRVGGEGGAVAFSVTAVGSMVTLDQVRAIEHPTDDPNEPISPDEGTLTLTATITDKDGDSDDASLDLSGSIVFRDDGPSISVKSVYDVDLAVDETVLATNDSVDVSGAFSGSFGADGSGSTTYAVTTVDGTDSGLVDVASGDSILLYNTASGVEGRVGGEGGAVAFSVTAVGSMVTLDQVRAIEHPTDDPNEPISPDEGTLTLTATITDKDGDSDDASLDLSGSIVFRDDGPHFESVMDAVISSATRISFTGLYDASFGADGLDYLSVALASGGTYGGVPVSFAQVATEDPLVSKVDVTNDLD
jgi:large repetitive protein